MRDEDENGDHPPKYARVGGPAKVPPGCDASLHSSSPAQVENTVVTTQTTNDATVQAPKKKGFLRRVWSGSHVVLYLLMEGPTSRPFGQ